MTSIQTLWLLLALSIGTFAQHREQKFAMEPQDQTAVVGSRVTLPCRVVDKTGVLQWTKDDFALGPHRNLSGFDRYAMIGSDEEGDYSLEIYPVMLDDDAKYQCQVSTGILGEPAIRSRFATLTVLVPPDPPRIVQGDTLYTTEDREIELECVSANGKPPAEMTWIDGSGTVMGNVRITEEPSIDGRRTTVKSTLVLTPKKEHHNTTFTCQAQNTADRTYKVAKLKLLVRYAPKVQVSVIGSNRLVEGTDVRLYCKAEANPSQMKYRWFVNDQPVPASSSATELFLTNITRKQHDSIVKCEVHNDVGKSEDSETLDVTYGPRFRARPYSVQVDRGAGVNLLCDVDGNPAPEIVWIHEDSDKVVGNSPNLTLLMTSDDLAGRYYCKASVMGFPEVGAEATVYLKGRPTIISHRTQFGIPGDTARIECSAFSIPPPDKVTWSYRGEEIGGNQSDDYSVLEDPLKEGIKSTLIIRESRHDHFGMYNCSVANPYGSDNVEILLKPQKSFPLLLILTGVIGCVVILVALTMVVILCQRKVKKPPPGNGIEHHVTAMDVEKNQCKESDNSSNISDIKLEFRTGSSVSNVHLDYAGHESETGSESVHTRIGVPLAGPVPMDQRYHRYSSADFANDVFPSLKQDGHNNNNGYVFSDFIRDYNQTLPKLSNSNHLPPSLSNSVIVTDKTPPPSHLTISSNNVVDPRYSATYGNPYLRQSPNLPPPHTGQPPPPPYSSVRNGGIPQASRLPTSPTSQFIVPNSTNHSTNIKRGTLATHV
uniref:Irregular chiasm C-roughest protein n=1 Tax=Cacopsylla melanoneura TaxID=428564 RepID=A0A8D9EC13_9HEMI